MKKLLVICVLLLAGISLAGCDEVQSSSQGSYQKDSTTLEQNTQKVNESVPVPKLETSQERINISKRAEIFNKSEKVSYIYLVNYGKVMAFYTVKGKVSSLRSYMTPVDKLVDSDGNTCKTKSSYSYSAGADPCYVVGSPDIDGSYGDNVDGIFFFTAEGAYVEWRGDYMMSDQPLKLTTQPELVRQVQ